MNPIFITNDSAQVIAAAVIFDLEAQQLVAALIPYAHGANHAELLKAIRASLTTNAERWISLRGEDLPRTVMLKGARRKYFVSAATMRQASADGRVEVWLHPATGDPRETALDFFYILAIEKTNLPVWFANRLNLAIPWPIKDEWAETIFNAALEAQLITQLPIVGQSAFVSAWRIEKDSAKWAVIINQAINSNQIKV